MIAMLLPLALEMLKLAPQIAADAPLFVQGIEQAWKVATAHEAPTADQLAQYQAALDETYQALQAA